MIKACIFDLDGVIVDTAKYHYLAWKRLAEELNINFNEKDNERLKGVSRMKSLDIILEIGNITLKESEKLEFADKKNKWYREYILKMEENEILPGVKTFLNQLKQNNLKIAIGSASKNALTILQRLNLIDIFDSIIDGNKVSKAKPDPEVFIKAAQEMHVKPEECVVFEDSIAGIQAAKIGKMKTIGVGNHQTLKEADKIINGFKNIDLKILEF
ncbi:beta-phosphoglucomutase [Oceanotoga teriensis]|uniref:beta-phosphoglucomutase n=1 Tax=Oceanotoga teriensis TaxID=515440 RepID=UPI002712FC4E|nr:beta-phosphoglucomutase [Oceanotoga teriensis]MDO7976577.1 beta-phosphoglucomutase [Oceanotoga teriensis]